MVLSVARRQAFVVPLAGSLAVVIGLLVAKDPVIAVGLVGAVAVAVVAFCAPVANLALILLLTAIVPYGLENRYSLGGGAGSPGLLVSDALLMAGLARTALVLLAMRLTRRELWAILAALSFIAIASLQSIFRDSATPTSRSARLMTRSSSLTRWSACWTRSS